ncbi:transposase [Micromonospora rifamycinica]
MAAAFAGEDKTDARDAVVIAQAIRMRPDIPILEPSARLLAELTVLTGYRADLVGQRVAILFRLQELLTGISPALERAVDLNRNAPMMVLACRQTPPRSATPASTGSPPCPGAGTSRTPSRSPRRWSPPPGSKP